MTSHPTPAISLKSAMKSLLMGQEPTPELFAILLVYFVQGILGLARLAITFLLKDDLGLNPAQVSAMMGIVFSPWMLKPLYGLMSDGLPIAGYRRRPYLIGSGMIGSVAWLALAFWVHSAWSATLALVLASLSVAVSDVIVDSIVVTQAQKESLSRSGSLQSLCWTTTAIGGILTAYLGGLLLEYFSARTIFVYTSTFPLVVAATAGLIRESPVEESLSVQAFKLQIGQLYQAITRKAIFWPMLFLFCLQLTPTAESAFFYFTTNELGFEPEFLGRINLFSSLANLLGVLIFQRFLKTIPFRRLFAGITVLSCLIGLTSLILVTHANRMVGIDDHWFSIGDTVVITVMSKIAFMPILVMAARLCPVGIEATLFAVLMSVTNFSGLVSHELEAILTQLLGITETNFTNLWLLIVITNFTTLLPLTLLRWIPDGDVPEVARQPMTSLETEPESVSPAFLSRWLSRLGVMPSMEKPLEVQ